MAEGARVTYHVQGIAPGRGRDPELALLLSRGHTADARAASESPGCEFGGHCEGECVGGRVGGLERQSGGGVAWSIGTCLSGRSARGI